jgi:RHS repeat-associated protein
MYDDDGKKTWSAELDIYGRVRTFDGRSLNSCPFRFQGQYEDAETGLYYNRFRYYDPDSGNYLSKDPIGLAGGTRLYGYVHDTNNWIDVIGWHATQVPYGSTDLSKMTQQYRIDNGITGGRNVAVFEIEVDGKVDYDIAVSRGKHSERILGERVPEGGKVTRIYSELEPCTINGGKCKEYIHKNFPDADVSYSFEYGETKASRKKGVSDLKKATKHH